MKKNLSKDENHTDFFNSFEAMNKKVKENSKSLLFLRNKNIFINNFSSCMCQQSVFSNL